MFFNSPEYALFLSLFIICYFTFPNKYRVFIILLASMIFYAQFSLSYLLILVCSIIANYVLGLTLSRQNEGRRKRFLILGLSFNILFMIFFKIDLVQILSGSKLSLAAINILMPLGISFYTFFNISYLIEIFRRRVQAETNIVNWASAVSFFPKILQGPIERPRFLEQIHRHHTFEYQRAVDGLKIIGWGLFKKYIVADRAAMFVRMVFDNPRKFDDLLFLATISFAFQIYLDFSGYIDIAIGTAKILGFDLSPNFNRPYFASSIREFWSRWHMSFSQWLRDYIFLPASYAISRRIKNDRFLGISTNGIIYFIAINLTFLICGLWHGMSWNFIIWGALFGIYLSISQMTRRIRKRVKEKISIVRVVADSTPWKIFWTFTFVNIAWIFFRTKNVTDALFFIAHIFQSARKCLDPLFLLRNLKNNHLLTFLIFVTIVFLVEILQKEGDILSFLNYQPGWFRWAFYYFIIISVFSFSVQDRSQFIYFQF